MFYLFSLIESHKDDLDKVLSSLREQFGQNFEHVIPELHAANTLVRVFLFFANEISRDNQIYFKHCFEQ